MKGVEGKIVDPQPQEDGGPAVGEIAVRGALVMKGYWNRPDATEAVMKDGWFLTGDLGYFDSKGNLFLTGRKKEVIVLSNGKNVYPEEIEAHYLKSPFIKEIAVMGLEGKPGEERDRLYAVIVPNFDVLRKRKIVNAKEVIRFDIEGLSSQIATTKRISSYEIWQDDLPRTTTRKIKRFEVQKRVQANQAKKLSHDSELPPEKPLTREDTAWLEQPDVQRGLKILRETSHSAPPNLQPTHNLELDLGLDSMQRVELLSRLEEELGGNLEESRLTEIYTVRDLMDAVLQSAASGDGKPASRAHFAGWKTILAEDPDDPEVLALTRPNRFKTTFWYLVSRLAQVIALDRFDLKVSGIEKLPKNGPYLLSSNHQSYLDPSDPGERNSRGTCSSDFSLSVRAKSSGRDSCAGWRALSMSLSSIPIRISFRPCGPGLSDCGMEWRWFSTPKASAASMASRASSRKVRPSCPPTCRCRSFRSRLKAFTTLGRATSLSRDSRR